MTLNILKANEEIKRLTAEVENIQAERAKLEQDVTRLTAERDDAAKTVESATAALEKSVAEGESLRKQLVDLEADVDRRASLKASEIVAQAGLPQPVDDTPKERTTSLIEQFQAITDPGERFLFYRKNATALLKQNFELKRNN